MSARPRGRPTKSLESQKLSKKIADSKRYLANKNQVKVDQSSSQDVTGKYLSTILTHLS